VTPLSAKIVASVPLGKLLTVTETPISGAPCPFWTTSLYFWMVAAPQNVKIHLWIRRSARLAEKRNLFPVSTKTHGKLSDTTTNANSAKTPTKR